MKNHTVVLFSFILFLLPLKIVSQELPKILPPSPEASSLGKFTEVPISHYTGLPNISIPLTSFEVGEKSFPVSLNYHARGIRVAEIASRVGVGWALNAGGSIIRQTRDRPDDTNNGYASYNGTSSYGNALTASLADNSFFLNQATRINVFANHITTTNYDLDEVPDKFMIQVNGIDAEFIYDYTDGQPLIQKFGDLKIETTYHSTTNIITGFIVTDKEGYKYYFGNSAFDSRTGTNLDQILAPLRVPMIGGPEYLQPPFFEESFNTWQLMDIISPNGDAASFYYSTEYPEYLRRSFDENLFGGNIVSHSTKLKSHQAQLDSIVFNQGKIKFIKENISREDLKLGYALDKIEILDSHNTLINTFDLHQSYQSTQANSVSYTNSFLIQAEPEASKHLFLNSIVKTGINGLSEPPTEFTYNAELLPNRFSNAQDFWGYFNGAANGQYLTLLDYFYDTSNGYDYYRVPYNTFSTDRMVDTVKSNAGMLERIKYPTGGSTKFYYEHNRGLMGTAFEGIDLPEINPINQRYEYLSFFDHANYDGFKYTKDIYIGDISGDLNINVGLPMWNNYNQMSECGNPISADCYFNMDLIGINGNNNSYYYIFSGSQQFEVVPGWYKMVFDPPAGWVSQPDPNDPEPFSYIFNFQLSWTEQVVGQENLLYAAGKRIKRIEYYNSDESLVSSKDYEYKSDEGSESGLILGLSSFTTTRRAAYIPQGGMPNLTVDFVEPEGAVPGSPFTTYQGNLIGYQNVIEYYGDKDGNNIGKTHYNYTNFRDSASDLTNIDNLDDYYTYPYHAPVNMQWLNGLPRTITHYKNDNGNYKKVKKIRNEYIFGDQTFSSGAELTPMIFLPQTIRKDLSENMTDLNRLHLKNDHMYRLPLVRGYYPYSNTVFALDSAAYKTYHLTGGTVDEYYSTVTNYDNNEIETLSTLTKHRYNYLNHYQPVKVISVTSDGIPMIQEFKYAQDNLTTFYQYSNPPNPQTIEDELDYRHRVVPLEITTYRDANNNDIGDPSEQISKTRTIYEDNWGNNVLEPKFVQTSKGDNTLKDRIEFKKYDSKGNILQVSKADGMDICYIYGYKNSLPVAKIENATYTQVQSYVSGIMNASDNDTTSCMATQSCNENNLRTIQTNLRNGLPNAMVTTYTYDPLIGITSMTDPKGYTVYYEYDDLHRLKRVKDEEGKVMSENKYHYLLDN